MLKLPKFIIVVLVGLTLPIHLFAAMTSTDYYIFADSINVGGIYSTGGSYILQDTLGEIAVGTSTGGSYDIKAGYQSMERGYITLSLGSNSISLGTLSASAVASGSTTVTVSTDSATGYTLSVGSFTGSGLASIGIGTSVATGTEGIGLSVSGSQAATSSDIALIPSQVLASANFPIDNSLTTVTFKASISSSTAANLNVTQTTVLTASANL